MREITVSLYQLDELDSAARARAIQEMRERLAGSWWDEVDNERVQGDMVDALAEALGTPGVDSYGEGDFSGIPGVEILGWDLDRGPGLLVRGELTRDNAPALPWVDGVDAAELRTTNMVTLEVDSDCDPTDEARLLDAARQALGRAASAGRRQMEWLSSEERAKEVIEINEYEFHADGALAEARLAMTGAQS